MGVSVSYNREKSLAGSVVKFGRKGEWWGKNFALIRSDWGFWGNWEKYKLRTVLFPHTQNGWQPVADNSNRSSLQRTRYPSAFCVASELKTMSGCFGGRLHRLKAEFLRRIVRLRIWLDHSKLWFLRFGIIGNVKSHTLKTVPVKFETDTNIRRKAIFAKAIDQKAIISFKIHK